MEEKERKKIILTALNEAHKAFESEEVPVGAVVFNTKTGEIITKAHNWVEKQKNPLHHAEIQAIEKALKKINDKFLSGYSIFITLEPCVMCAGAIAWARLDGLFYGASDPKTGAIEQGAKVFSHSQTHHKLKVAKWPNLECGALMTQFFKRKRK
ncbi:MAG: nucleoside deaminase [Alphaproteobacteria bacterium]|nr:nucleoside deaminase [Alphaproteobacteria bacterium]